MNQMTERAATYGAGYRAGFEMALQDVLASADHWEQCGAKSLLLRPIRDTVEAVRSGWYCGEPSHTHPACLARKPVGGGA